MRYLLRICDRCGAEIERQRGFRAYDTIIQFIQSGPEFCDSCKRDFAEFMEGGKKVESRECEYLNFCPKCGHPMFSAEMPDGTITWACEKCGCGPDGQPAPVGEILRAAVDKMLDRKETEE